MTAADAAKLWLDGDREGCEGWCRGDYGPYMKRPDDYGSTRTAAVALELWKEQSDASHKVWTFLRYMSGEPE